MIEKRNISIVLVVLVGVVGAAIISGCVQEGAKETIKIGASLSLSGGRAYANQHALAGIQVAIDEINREGGIYVKEYGKKLPVELVWYNDEGDPSKAVMLAKKLIEEDEVDFILISYGTKMYNTYAPIIDEYNGRVLGFGASAYIYKPYTYSFSFFPAGTKYGDLVSEFTKWLVDNKLIQHSKVADIRPVDWKATIDYDKQRRAALGLETVYVQTYTRGQVEDFTPFIRAAVSAGADSLLSSCIIPDGPLLSAQLKASGLMSKFKFIWLLGFGLYPEKHYEVAGKDTFEGVFTDTYPPEHLFPAVKEVNDAVRKKLGLGPGDPVEFGAVTYYTIVVTLKKAIEEAGTLDKEKIRKTLLSFNYTDPRIGKIKFYRDAELQKTRKTHWQQTSDAALYLAQQQNGQIEVVWPPEFATAKPIYPYPYS